MKLNFILKCIVILLICSCGSDSKDSLGNFSYSHIEIGECKLFVTEYDALNQISTLVDRLDLLNDLNLSTADLAQFINEQTFNLPANSLFECIEIINETEILFVSRDSGGNRTEQSRTYTISPDNHFVFSFTRSNLQRRENELALHAYFLGLPEPDGMFPTYDIDNTLSTDVDVILESIIDDIPLQAGSHGDAVLLCQFNYVFSQK